jgi:hypothetical protein
MSIKNCSIGFDLSDALEEEFHIVFNRDLELPLRQNVWEDVYSKLFIELEIQLKEQLKSNLSLLL